MGAAWYVWIGLYIAFCQGHWSNKGLSVHASYSSVYGESVPQSVSLEGVGMVDYKCFLCQSCAWPAKLFAGCDTRGANKQRSSVGLSNESTVGSSWGPNWLYVVQSTLVYMMVLLLAQPPPLAFCGPTFPVLPSGSQPSLATVCLWQRRHWSVLINLQRPVHEPNGARPHDWLDWLSGLRWQRDFDHFSKVVLRLALLSVNNDWSYNFRPGYKFI